MVVMFMACPICNSEKYVKRGKTAAGSQRYKCFVCKKTFADSPKIPFEFIAFMLYQKSLLEENGRPLKMKHFKGLAERYLRTLDLINKEVPRATLYYWLKTYSDSYKKIPYRQTLQFLARHRRKLTREEIEKINDEYDEYMKSTKPSYMDYLQWLEETYGKDGARILSWGDI
jgi:hypothetical protein